MRAAVVYLLLYAASFALCRRAGALDASDLVGIVAVLGVGFSALAYLVTRKLRPPVLPVRDPRGELVAALCLLAFIALWLVFGAALLEKLSLRPGSAQGKAVLVLVRKLAVFAALPYLIFRYRFGYRLADFGLSRSSLRALAGREGAATLAMILAICVFQYFSGQAAAPIHKGEIAGASLWLGLPLCFAWLAVEAGLVEELFFRAILMTRLAAFFRSELAGLVLMSLLFGLAHAPGFIFRGAGGVEGLGEHPSAPLALAYSVAVVSVAGFYLGIFYGRTRNLLAVIFVHAGTDLLPNLAEFVRTWRL